MAQNDTLLAAYLVVGPDELRRNQIIERLKQRVDEAFQIYDVDEFTVTPETDAAAILSSLDMLPFGGGPRIVIVDGADRLSKQASEALITYLADPNPSSTLALVAEKLSKSTRLYKAVAKVGSKAVIECPAKRGRELPPYVQRIARSHGVEINSDAVSELVARVGDSSIMLDTQLSTLADLLGGSGRITRELVEEHVPRLVEVKPWEFLDRLSERDLERSLELLQLLEGSRLGLLSLVEGRLRELICAKSLDARGQARDLASELGKQDWQVKNYVRWSRGFADGELEDLLGDCAQTERTLKSGGDSEAAMTLLVAHICGK